MKRILAVLLSVSLIWTSFLGYTAFADEDEYGAEEILEAAEGIVNWKKSTLDLENTEPLMQKKFLKSAGSSTADWYVIGLCRIGISDEYGEYLSALKLHVEELYNGDTLTTANATEWHRISLAIQSAGGNPTEFGVTSEGETINLIADGTYQRDRIAPLGKQGLNGYIWGLIALDSMQYQIPDSADYTRERIITEILNGQLKEGAFSLNGSSADVDITAMALQALAPYYDSEQKFICEQQGEAVIRTVQGAVDEALVWLSDVQMEDGDFASFGTANAESTAQVIIALTSLGIDPQRDERFIKGANNVLDGLMKYQMEDGGFAHSVTYVEGNPATYQPRSNQLAGAQALCALASVYRQMKQKSMIYHFYDTGFTAPEESSSAAGDLRGGTDSAEEGEESSPKNDSISEEDSSEQKIAGSTDEINFETESENVQDIVQKRSVTVKIIAVGLLVLITAVWIADRKLRRKKKERL